MRCGLYGKLPAKRDFVAVAASRDFLGAYEPWLQGSIAASRTRLGAAWQEAFLRAPIWRFWLGADLCGGGAALGALMPSVDGVGRYFPLTVFAHAEPGEDLAPPEIEPHADWFGEAEGLLLSALTEGLRYEDFLEALGRLAPPAPRPADPLPPGAVELSGAVAVPVAPADLPGTIAALRRRDGGGGAASRSFWWCEGGEDFPARLVVARRMPDPYLFAGMLTGRFDEAQ